MPDYFHRHALPQQGRVNPGAYLHHITRDLMSRRKLVRLGLVHVHLQVRAAYPDRPHAQYHVARAGLRLLCLSHLHTSVAVEESRLHRSHVHPSL